METLFTIVVVTADTVPSTNMLLAFQNATAEINFNAKDNRSMSEIKIHAKANARDSAPTTLMKYKSEMSTIPFYHSLYIYILKYIYF